MSLGEFMNEVQPNPKPEEIKVDPWKVSIQE